MTPTQIALPKRAVVRRINCKLRPRHERLYLVKSHAAQAQGTWFVLDEKNNSITAKGYDLEAVARSLSALQPFERLAQ